MKRIFIFSILTAVAGLLTQGATVSKLALPWVFPGYRSLSRQWLPDTVPQATPSMWRAAEDSIRAREEAEIRERLIKAGVKIPDDYMAKTDTVTVAGTDTELDWGDAIPSYQAPEEQFDFDHPYELNTSDWLRDVIRERSIADDFMYGLMVKQPHYIQYAVWDLPVPPSLPEEDHSFIAYIRGMNLPDVDIDEVEISRKGPEQRINWLHNFNIALQLSQAYISHNWYQGGNDYLAFFGNFLWDVQLNPVYNPRVMFQSTVNYKLAITSTQEDQFHKYAISQELFQYNLKFGYKAANRWYYSLTGLFKTQFLNSYASNSETRTASFLSPGTANVGIGMTYNYEKPNKKLSFSASIAPLSYNLKICLDDKIDHASLGMKPDQRTLHEYGSNAELNFYCAFRDNISYRSRLFLFTDYKNFVGDWENTLNFQFSKYFSTQLYFYFRYDTATDSGIDRKWKKWMLKEILSVGLSYTFSTK